jgi:hypothetical protein
VPSYGIARRAGIRQALGGTHYGGNVGVGTTKGGQPAIPVGGKDTPGGL